MPSRADNFNRANTTHPLGVPSDGGMEWAQPQGNQWGIAGNQAYSSSGISNATAYLETTDITDMVVQATVTTVGSNFGVLARGLDQNNFILFQWAAGFGFRFFRRVGGTFTALAADVPGTPSAGDVFRLECSGNSLTARRNGVIVFGPITEAALNTNTRGGLYASNDTATRFDDFSVGTGITGPTFTTQPSNQTVAQPDTASFPWASSGAIDGFQVQQRRGGGAWTNVPDGTGASGGAGTNVSGTYTTTATAVSTGNHRNGDQYRVVLNPSGTPVNSNAATLTVTVPTATQLVLSVPDAAGLSGFSGIVLSASAPGAGVTVIATPTSITFNGSGQATINVTGLGIPIGARRWVSVTNSNGDPAQSPAPVQAQGPVTAS